MCQPQGVPLQNLIVNLPHLTIQFNAHLQHILQPAVGEQPSEPHALERERLLCVPCVPRPSMGPRKSGEFPHLPPPVRLAPSPARARAALGAGPLQMLRAKSNPRISTPDVSSDQSVDWEQRDFTQTIQLGMTQLTAFLNEFGTHACLLHLPAAPIADWPRDRTDGTMRGRMAQLNGKLGKLERQMQVIEATLTSVDDKQ